LFYATCIDSFDARMSVWAADHDGMAHTGQNMVVGVQGLAGDQAWILAAADS
jgi:hypothetical protein